MNKKALCAIIMLLCIFFMIPTVHAQNYSYINEETHYTLLIEDDVELLSEEEISNLVVDMMPLTSYGNIAFKSANNDSLSTQGYADKFYHDQFGITDGSLFLVDMYNRMIYIFSDGKNYEVISKSKAEIITDNVYRYASKQDYYGCASKAFSQMKSLLSGEKIVEPMRHMSNILIATTIGFLINFIIILSHSRIKQATIDEILRKCKINFQITNIKAEKYGEHRTYSPVSSGSSGFSSGGHSSGGGGHSSHSSHSSGGGGGHRF